LENVAISVPGIAAMAKGRFLFTALEVDEVKGEYLFDPFRSFS
jgi:hypothetical protein